MKRFSSLYGFELRLFMRNIINVFFVLFFPAGMLFSAASATHPDLFLEGMEQSMCRLRLLSA